MIRCGTRCTGGHRYHTPTRATSGGRRSRIRHSVKFEFARSFVASRLHSDLLRTQPAPCAMLTTEQRVYSNGNLHWTATYQGLTFYASALQKTPHCNSTQPTSPRRSRHVCQRTSTSFNPRLLLRRPPLPLPRLVPSPPTSPKIAPNFSSHKPQFLFFYASSFT